MVVWLGRLIAAELRHATVTIESHLRDIVFSQENIYRSKHFFDYWNKPIYDAPTIPTFSSISSEKARKIKRSTYSLLTYLLIEYVRFDHFWTDPYTLIYDLGPCDSSRLKLSLWLNVNLVGIYPLVRRKREIGGYVGKVYVGCPKKDVTWALRLYSKYWG
jgi:hypothetical protein